MVLPRQLKSTSSVGLHCQLRSQNNWMSAIAFIVFLPFFLTDWLWKEFVLHLLASGFRQDLKGRVRLFYSCGDDSSSTHHERPGNN